MGALSKFMKLPFMKSRLLSVLASRQVIKTGYNHMIAVWYLSVILQNILKGRMMDHLRNLTGSGLDLWQCRSTGTQAQSSS